MYTPTLRQARALGGTAKFAPIYREVLADLETPVSAYLKLGGGRNSFLLESVEGGENVGRYSFIGTAPREVLEIREDGASLETPDGTRPLTYSDPLVLLDELLGREKMARLARPAALRRRRGRVHDLRDRPLLRAAAGGRERPARLPLARLMFVDTLLVFDHTRRTIKAVTRCRSTATWRRLRGGL
jgi:anthranilate synthase component 1